jgi:hypothetical protein
MDANAEYGIIAARLAAEFSGLNRAVVDRFVRDTWWCARSVCAAITAEAIEQLAREHLIAAANSDPPHHPAARPRRSRLDLAADAGDHPHPVGVLEGLAGFGPPRGERDKAGFDELEPVEVGRHLGPGPQLSARAGLNRP